MDIDPNAIKEQIAWLNKNYPPARWDAVEGLHAAYAVVLNPNGTQDVNTGRGLTYKYFINKSTKELKAFYYVKFMKKN